MRAKLFSFSRHNEKWILCYNLLVLHFSSFTKYKRKVEECRPLLFSSFFFFYKRMSNVPTARRSSTWHGKSTKLRYTCFFRHERLNSSWSTLYFMKLYLLFASTRFLFFYKWWVIATVDYSMLRKRRTTSKGAQIVPFFQFLIPFCTQILFTPTHSALDHKKLVNIEVKGFTFTTTKSPISFSTKYTVWSLLRNVKVPCNL